MQKRNVTGLSRESIIRILVSIVVICIVGAGLIGAYLYFANRIKPLSINEVCTKNEEVIADSEGKYYDYIELYNASDRTISLQGYGLSDDEMDPYKYRFSENALLLPQQSLIVYATKKGAGTSLYTGFSLDADMENMLYLTDNSGTLLDEVAIPLLKQDIAYGRVIDGERKLTTLLPSPGELNTTTGIYVDVAEPEFSVPGGFCDGGTELVLATEEDNNLTIYYTLDNTTPTVESAQYTSSFVLENPSLQENHYRNYANVTLDNSYTPPTEPVDKAVIVKAMAVDRDGNQSDVVTNTYFVDLAEKESYQTGLMISMSTEPENLFDEEEGIYVTGTSYDIWYQAGQEGEAPTANFQIKGETSERPAYLEIYDQTSNSLVSQNIGIRIQGASTRQYAQKRFSLFAREMYGTDKYFPYDFWGNQVRTHSLVLRTNFFDAFAQSFMEGKSVSVQRGMAAHVFLEGEYWGDYYLQEKYGDEYLEEYYQVDNNNVILIKNHEVEVGEESDMDAYLTFYDYLVNTDMSVPANYEKACTMMDVQSYIEMVATQVYFCNMDWNSQRMVCWKVREVSDDAYGDGRWRFMLYDCDALSWGSGLAKVCNAESVAAIDSFSSPMPYSGPSVMTNGIFDSLLASPSFKEDFVSTFTELANTTFSYENVSEKMKEWNIEDTYYDTFFRERHDYIMQYMEEAIYPNGRNVE